MAGLGTLPSSAKYRVLEGISSLECPLFSHSFLPMNSGHSSLQIDWIEVGGSSLWSFCVHIGWQDTDNRWHNTCCSLLFFCLRLLPTSVSLCLTVNPFSGSSPIPSDENSSWTYLCRCSFLFSYALLLCRSKAWRKKNRFTVNTCDVTRFKMTKIMFIL